MVFTHNYEIEFLHINNDKTLKDKSLLFFLENIATRHSDFCGYGIDYILDNNQGWILLDWNLKIFERPKYGEMLEINTWISEITKLFCYRNFEIKSNGKIKAVASSKWILYDLINSKPIKLTDELVAKYEPEPDRKIELDETKLVEEKNYDEEINYILRKSDIDLNYHVHNLNYLDMAYEILNTNQNFDNIKIVFKKEIKLTDIIKIMHSLKDNKHYFCIKNAETNQTNALIETF